MIPARTSSPNSRRRGRRERHAHGLHRGGRAPLAPGHPEHGRGARETKGVRLPVHEHGAAAPAPGRFTPSHYFSWVVHLDGLQERHDAAVDRSRRLHEAVTAIREAKARGFRVTTNSTFFNTDSPKTVRDGARLPNDDLKVDAMMISPAYAYEKAPDQEHFLGVEQTRELFKEAFSDKRQGEVAPQPLAVVPRLPGGQGRLPVHGLGDPELLGVRLATAVLPHGRQLRQDLPRARRDDRLGARTDRGRDPRCANCMAHCGYEPSAVISQHRLAASSPCERLVNTH